MIDTLLLVLSTTGFLLLLSVQVRHQDQWLGRRLTSTARRTVRVVGSCALGSAFVLAGASFGWSYGTLLWFGWLTAGATLAIVVNKGRERLMEATGR